MIAAFNISYSQHHLLKSTTVGLYLHISIGNIDAGKGLTSWFSFVVYNGEFATFPLVSWVRCGT